MGSRLQPWYRAFVWFCYSCLGIVVPVGIGALIVGAASDTTLGTFTDGGQFAIYTSTMLAGTVYLVTKPAAFPLRFTEWFGWAAVIGLILATSLFVLATLSSSGEDIDRDFFRWPSIALSLVSLGVAYIAVGFDECRSEIDLREKMRIEGEELRKEFRETPSSSGGSA